MIFKTLERTLVELTGTIKTILSPEEYEINIDTKFAGRGYLVYKRAILKRLLFIGLNKNLRGELK